MDKEACPSPDHPSWTEKQRADSIRATAAGIGEKIIHPTFSPEGDMIPGMNYRQYLVGQALSGAPCGEPYAVAGRAIALVNATLEALAKEEIEKVEYGLAEEQAQGE